MKILTTQPNISIDFHHKNLYTNDKNKNTLLLQLQQKPALLPAGYYFPINFKGDTDNIEKQLKQLENIHCPVCGVKMLSQNEMKRLLKQGQKITDVTMFCDWLEKNKDNINPKYRKFVESAKRNSQEFNTNSIDDLLKNMQESAFIASQNTIDEMKKIIEEAQNTKKFSDSDNVLLEECYIRLDNFDVKSTQGILKPIKNILIETIGNLENESEKPLYNSLIKKIFPVAEYQSFFNDFLYKKSNIPYKDIVLQKLFTPSSSNIQKIINYKNSTENIDVNYVLTCNECKIPKDGVFFSYHKNKPDIEKNFITYLEDIGKNILNHQLTGHSEYPFGLINLVSKTSGNKYKVDIYKNPVLKELKIQNFEDYKNTIDFEPVNHEGIPCASCGNMTITHEQKLQLYKQVENTKDLKELYELLSNNKQYIGKKYYDTLREIGLILVKNPKISEIELISELRKYEALNIKNKLNKAIKLAEYLVPDASSNDQQLLTQFIQEAKTSFCENYDNKLFPYNKYNNLIKRTIYCVESEKIKTIHGYQFKEPIRKAFTRQGLLYPNKETIEKVGSISKVIAQDMFKGSIATIDHLVAKNRQGWENIANYVVMCKNCNNEKTNYSIMHWLDIHPPVAKNMQKYMDVIVDKLHKGEFKEEYMKKYPFVFAKCLKILTQGKAVIRFDSSKFEN